MSKGNFDLLQVMIRKTLDDTHKKDVLDYFKKGKITEKEKDELLAEIKIICSVVRDEITVRGYCGEMERLKGTGWKIHLAVDPKNYQYVFRWLFLYCPKTIGWKHLHGGMADSGKDFTIYVGSWDDMFKFAGVLEKELTGRLKEFDQAENTDDIGIYPPVGARFQLSADLSGRDATYRATDKKFTYYGWQGVSFLGDDVKKVIKLNDPNATDYNFVGPVWGWYKELVTIRAYKELGRMFGDYFLGTKRPNLLTKTFEVLEKKYGSELPTPGRPCVADIVNLTDNGFPYKDFPDVGNALLENKNFLRKNIFAPDGKPRRDSLWYSAWGQFLKVLPVLMGTKLASLLRNKDGVKVILNQVKDVISSADIGLIAFAPSLLAWYLVEFNDNRKPSASRTRKIEEIYDQRYKQTNKQPSFKEVCEMARNAPA